MSQIGCDSKEDQGVVGTYQNLKSDIELNIKETMGFDQVEYVLTELRAHRLGRFDIRRHGEYKMTVFKNIRPDNFAYYLIFSEDYRFVYSDETGELLYVKKQYYDSLSAKEKEDLKTTINYDRFYLTTLAMVYCWPSNCICDAFAILFWKNLWGFLEFGKYVYHSRGRKV
ncbi:hypothetical protein UMM65_13210 [Aureibaculum sp. 2210JD6-5]|nr:hypothetical protein [Aureibaculum sp. 2210JD6-5]